MQASIYIIIIIKQFVLHRVRESAQILHSFPFVPANSLDMYLLFVENNGFYNGKCSKRPPHAYLWSSLGK